MIIRIKLCLTWAITNEREGSYRALVVAKLFVMRILLARRVDIEPFAGFTLQHILVDFIGHHLPNLKSESYRKEYANVILLFIELQRFHLFDHDLYVRGKLVNKIKFEFCNWIMLFQG